MEALSWYFKVAEQGHSSALHAIGNYFQRNTFDYVAAYMWYVLAIDLYNVEDQWKQLTQSNLSKLERDGKVNEVQINEAKQMAAIWKRERKIK